MEGGRHMAKQLDCKASIASTQNNGMHGIHSSQHTTFNRLDHFSSKRNRGSISGRGMDWTTSKSNHFNLQMPCKNTCLNSILSFAMIVGLKIIRISSEHSTTGIYSNEIQFFLAHLPSQAHHNFDLVHVAHSKSY
jgi:hypothetical protein